MRFWGVEPGRWPSTPSLILRRVKRFYTMTSLASIPGSTKRNSTPWVIPRSLRSPPIKLCLIILALLLWTFYHPLNSSTPCYPSEVVENSLFPSALLASAKSKPNLCWTEVPSAPIPLTSDNYEGRGAHPSWKKPSKRGIHSFESTRSFTFPPNSVVAAYSESTWTPG